MDAKEYAKEWMEQFASEIGFPVEEILFRAEQWLNTGGSDGSWDGEYWCEGGAFEGQSVPRLAEMLFMWLWSL